MITEGYLLRHSLGRSGGRDIALLDVAQDYALKLLHDHGIFDLGVVLKGGTSLRKFRAGNAGRFSTDLDFATPDADVAEFVVDTLDGADLFGIRIRVADRERLRGRLRFETPLGPIKIAAKLELSPRPLWLPTPAMIPITLPVHKGYEFSLPALPLPTLEEAISEKLAAWRRRRKIRDLYDLHWFAQGAFDEPLVRRLFVLKVWHDVVEDGLGHSPLDPADAVADVDLRRLPPEDIGLLTQPVEPEAWLCSIRARYGFLTEVDEEEQRVATCSPGDRDLVGKLVAALTSVP